MAGPEVHDPHVELAFDLLREGKATDALALALRCADGPRRRLALAHILTDLTRWKEARAAWETVIVHDGQLDATHELRRALACAGAGVVPQAIDLVERAMDATEEPAIVRAALRLLLDVGAVDEAALSVARLERSDARSAACEVIEEEAGAGRVERALWVARALLVSFPNDAERWALVAWLAGAARRDKEAHDAMRWAVSIPPLLGATARRLLAANVDRVGEVASHMGRMLQDGGEHALALGYFQLAGESFEARRSPQGDKAAGVCWMDLGASLVALRRFEEGVPILERAVELMEAAGDRKAAATAREGRSIALAGAAARRTS